MRQEMRATAFDVAAWLKHAPHSCPAPHVSQPTQIGRGWTKAAAVAGGPSSFRYGDASGLLPFSLPALPASLDGGSYVANEDTAADIGVEVVIRAAAAAGASLGDADVLTFRNNLNKIFGTPFDLKAGWAVDACLLPAAPARSSAAAAAGTSSSTPVTTSSGDGGSGGGTLFLDIVRTEQGWVGYRTEMERFTRWGYMFEALCTGQAVADASREYGSLQRTRIAQHRILMGAEVDCFDPSHPDAASWQAAGQQQPQQQQQGQSQGPAVQAQLAEGPAVPPLSTWLELKTYRLPAHRGQYNSLYRFKHAKWWLQSFLAGVPRLALGGRDDEGNVLRIDLVATKDLPRISAANGCSWSGDQALHLGAAALAWMRQQAQQAPGQHLRFTYEGASSGRDASSGSGAGGGDAGFGGGRRAGGGRPAAQAGVVQCEVVEGGALPQRVRECLRECGLL